MIRIIQTLEKANQSIKNPNFQVRDIQLLSLILFIEKQPESGRLLQINTGEGKSFIVQMLAAFQALNGRKVDIFTSNNSLAERDSDEAYEFYSKLGLSVGYMDSQNPEDTYQSQIVYGTIHSFCVGHLKQFMQVIDSSQGRGHEYLIVDEVDSMFIDRPEITTFLSQESQHKNNLSRLLGQVWSKFRDVEQIYQRKGLDFDEDQAKVYDSMLQMITELVGQETDKDFTKLVKGRKDTWVQNLFKTRRMTKDEDYVIQDQRVQIIDRDTGETLESSRWANGLHLFIEKKHGLVTNLITSTVIFQNHIEFIQKYGSNVIGLTGTLGSKVARKFLRTQYKVDLIDVPPYCEQQLDISKVPLTCENAKKWRERIFQEIKERHPKRPVLVIFEDIKKAKEMESFLNYKKIEPAMYIRSDHEFASEDFQLKADSVVIATNLGGRGTNFQVGWDLSATGGLHVILTFLPPNSRIRRQAFGRAGRKGQKGSGQLVLNLEDNEEYRDRVFQHF